VGLPGIKCPFAEEEMKSLEPLIALITGILLFTVQYRHSESFWDAISKGPRLSDRIDKTDKILLFAAALSFILLLILIVV
jgi:hypothetical protein